MEQLLIGAILVLIVLVVDTRQKLAAMRQQISDLEGRQNFSPPQQSPVEFE